MVPSSTFRIIVLLGRVDATQPKIELMDGLLRARQLGLGPSISAVLTGQLSYPQKIRNKDSIALTELTTSSRG